MAETEIKEINEKPKISLNRLKSSLYVFKYIKPYKKYFVMGLILLTLSSILFLALMPMGGFMLNIALGTSKYDISLTQAGIILFIIFIIQGIISYFRMMMFSIVSERATADMRKELYHRLISLPYTFFEKSRVGEITSRIASDVDQLYSAFSITLAEFIRQFIVLIGSIILLLYFNAKLSLIMLSVFPAIVVGAMYFGRYIRTESKKRQEDLAATNVILDESLQSIYSVKSYTNEKLEYHRYADKINSMVGTALKLSRYRSLFASYVIIAIFGALFFVIWMGVKFVEAKTMTAGDLLNVFSFTATIGVSIASLGNFYTQLVSVVGGTERLREILSKIPEVYFDDDKREIKLPYRANISFKNVQFSYPSRPDVQVMKKISFDIKAGQKVAFVGSSGAGKSTIAQLILRFYEIQSGEILIGDKNINEYNISDYRSFIGIVPQEVLLFGGTIRENILYGKPTASDQEVIEAAKQSNSWDFISSFPDKMETIVGERGIKLSGGQKQRIAIARALLKNPSILILDEATSALDAESEKVVQDALNKLMEGRTSVIIAHRLSTIREADCIYVLDDGIIVEKGRHDDLAAIPNGPYSNLAKLQFENNKRLGTPALSISLADN